MGPTKMSVTVPSDFTSIIWSRNEDVVKNKWALPPPHEDVITLSDIELSESHDDEKFAITLKSSIVTWKVYEKNPIWQPMWAVKFTWAEQVKDVDNKATQVRCLVCTKVVARLGLLEPSNMHCGSTWVHKARKGTIHS
ncbi:unnamed protein product [Calypogeia fissa]